MLNTYFEILNLPNVIFKHRSIVYVDIGKTNLSISFIKGQF